MGEAHALISSGSPASTPRLTAADSPHEESSPPQSAPPNGARPMRAPEQLLHGEPHPGNVLNTKYGPLFIDFENTARGPVEYDLAWVPEEVSEGSPDADQDLLDECRGVVMAIIAMHRWHRDDQHPSGRQSGVAFLDALRDGPPWPALDAVHW